MSTEATARWGFVVLLGCGPSTEPEAPSATDTPGADAPTSSSDASSAPVDDPAEEGCAGVLADDPPGDEIVITFRNATDHDVWFDRFSCLFPFSVEGPRGESVTGAIYGRCNSCESLLEEGGEPWCEDHCDGASVRVVPGGVYAETWDGRLREPMGVMCEGRGRPATCDVAYRADAGTYAVRLEIQESCGALPDACMCEPDADGSCEVFGGSGMPSDHVLETSFTLPGSTEVDLVLR